MKMNSLCDHSAEKNRNIMFSPHSTIATRIADFIVIGMKSCNYPIAFNVTIGNKILHCSLFLLFLSNFIISAVVARGNDSGRCMFSTN